MDKSAPLMLTDSGLFFVGLPTVLVHGLDVFLIRLGITHSSHLNLTHPFAGGIVFARSDITPAVGLVPSQTWTTIYIIVVLNLPPPSSSMPKDDQEYGQINYSLAISVDYKMAEAESAQDHGAHCSCISLPCQEDDNSYPYSALREDLSGAGGDSNVPQSTSSNPEDPPFSSFGRSNGDNTPSHIAPRTNVVFPDRITSNNNAVHDRAALERQHRLHVIRYLISRLHRRPTEQEISAMLPPTWTRPLIIQTHRYRYLTDLHHRRGTVLQRRPLVGRTNLESAESTSERRPLSTFRRGHRRMPAQDLDIHLGRPRFRRAWHQENDVRSRSNLHRFFGRGNYQGPSVEDDSESTTTSYRSYPRRRTTQPSNTASEDGPRSVGGPPYYGVNIHLDGTGDRPTHGVQSEDPRCRGERSFDVSSAREDSPKYSSRQYGPRSPDEGSSTISRCTRCKRMCRTCVASLCHPLTLSRLFRRPGPAAEPNYYDDTEEIERRLDVEDARYDDDAIELQEMGDPAPNQHLPRAPAPTYDQRQRPRPPVFTGPSYTAADPRDPRAYDGIINPPPHQTGPVRQRDQDLWHTIALGMEQVRIHRRLVGLIMVFLLVLYLAWVFSTQRFFA